MWLDANDATVRRRTLKRLAVRGEAAERITALPRERVRWARELARARGRGAIDAVLAPLDEESLLAFWSLAAPADRRRIARWARELARARGRGAIDAVLAPVDEESLLAFWSLVAPADRRRIARWAREDRGRRPPVSGADLVAAGLSGPVVGVALARIRAAFLDGAVPDRESALALAQEVAAREAAREARRARRRARDHAGAARPPRATRRPAGAPPPDPTDGELGCPPKTDLP